MTENNDHLICSDLDRTIIPNGDSPESPNALPALRKFAEHPFITLVYVSGRDKGLLGEAITKYDLPVPDMAVGDVGTSIFEVAQTPDGPEFTMRTDWQEQIARDWKGKTGKDLARFFDDLKELRLQEPEKQNTFKLSYYADVDADKSGTVQTMKSRLKEKLIAADVIWSIDEQIKTGLIDVIPERATKVHAVWFLMEETGFLESRTIFAGDSGNDIPALTSGLNAVIVKNASKEVKNQAKKMVSEKGYPDKLYIAEGDFFDLNGNYSAGVLEGAYHFLEKTRPVIKSILEKT